MLEATPQIELQQATGRPQVAGTRIAVMPLVRHAEEQGWPLKRIAARYGLETAAVRAALDYYAAHEAEVEAVEAAYEDQLLRQHMTSACYCDPELSE